MVAQGEVKEIQMDSVKEDPKNPSHLETTEDGKETEGVNILLGDPKKAVFNLSIPIIVAMSVQTIYSLSDTFWVAGLGADALAAVGFSVRSL